MTVNTQVRTAGPYAGNGTTATYPFAFKVFQASELVATITNADGTLDQLALSSDFTVSLNSDQNAFPGGSITLLAGNLASGRQLTMTSDVSVLQPTELTNQGGFFPKVIENALDRLTILLQQYGFVNFNRAVRVPEIAGIQALPSAPNRAGKLLAFNDSGQPITVAPSDQSAASLALQLVAPDGSSLIGFKQNAVAAIAWDVQSELRTRVGVWQFGAYGIGDDTAAIRAAIAFCKANGVGCLEFDGLRTYTVSGMLDFSGSFGMQGLLVSLNGCTIKGTHNGPVMRSLPCGASSADAAPEYRQNLTVTKGRIVGPGATATTNTNTSGFYIQQGAGVKLHDLSISGCYKGLYGYGALICSFHQLHLDGNFFGFSLERSPEQGYIPEFGPNDIHFYDCKVINNKRAGRAIDFPAGAMSFHGCEIEGNNIGGNSTDGVRNLEFFNAGKVAFYSPHIEDMPGEVAVSYHGANAYCHLIMIGGEFIPGDANVGRGLHLNNAGNPDAAANAWIDGTRITKNTGDAIYIDGGFKGMIRGNPFGNINGNLQGFTFYFDGKIGVGVLPSPQAALKLAATALNPIPLDINGLTRIVDTAGDRVGYLGDNGASTFIFGDVNRSLRLGAGNGGQVVEVGRLNTPTFEPGADNTYQLGTPSVRWSQLFAGTATVSTSDADYKQDAGAIPEAVLRAWGRVKYQQYRFKDAVQSKGDGARWHIGVIAQQVKAAFEAEGFDPFAYGLLCWDEWPDHFEPVLDENQQPTGEQRLVTPAGSRYGVRYEEALALEAAYVRWRLDNPSA